MFFSNGIMVGKNNRGMGIKFLWGRLQLPESLVPPHCGHLGGGGGQGMIDKAEESQKALVGYTGAGRGSTWARGSLDSGLASSPFPSLSWL